MLKVKILWGKERDSDNIETYKFDTQAELKAFLKGVYECDGWQHWEIISQDTELPKAEKKLSIELTPTESNAIMVMLDNEMENHFSEGVDLEVWENLNLDAYRMLAFHKFKTWYEENV